MEDISKLIGRLEKEISDKSRELLLIRTQLVKYQDLGYEVDRWRNTRLSSSCVNSVADQVDICHSCGCCEDATLLVMPFVQEGEQKVYSKPVMFNVGEKAYYGGDNPYPGWRTKLFEAGIQKVVVELVEKYFESNKPQKCDEEDE